MEPTTSGYERGFAVGIGGCGVKSWYTRKDYEGRNVARERCSMMDACEGTVRQISFTADFRLGS